MLLGALLAAFIVFRLAAAHDGGAMAVFFIGIDEMKIEAGIIGVSGYGGGEIARLLDAHPDVEITYVVSNTYQGQPLFAALPGIPQRNPLMCEAYDEEKAIANCDVLFLAQETGFAAKHAAALADADKKVIDISADLRLKDRQTYTKWYKAEAAPQPVIDRAVYGLPELLREQIRDAKIVANPGCYPTSAILALAPLVAADAIDLSHVIINSLSGVSGAGRSKFSLDYHFPEINESVSAYGVAGAHRHTPEIEQAVSWIVGSPVTVSFTPHLIPITRGILTTVVADLLTDMKTPDVVNLLHEYYAKEPFVNVLPAGKLPAIKHTHGSNYVHIGAAVDERTGRATVITTLDNLIKGAAGQAIQNMNLMYGLDETTGLKMAGIFP
jgi:N-acetyl-gamma-glutamyl-phosphate reductase